LRPLTFAAAATLALGFGAPACSPAEPDALVPVEGVPRYALLFSDFSSSSIGLVDDELGMLAPDWVTSGTRTPILVVAVTGDAVLPTEPLGSGLLTWIDRLPADVVTLVDPTAPTTLTQLDVHGMRGDPATGYVANPHDALRLPDGRILVSRHNPDPALFGTAEARGSDLIAIDESTGRFTRVALGCDGGAFARPDQLAMLRASERDVVLVALARLGAVFDDTIVDGGFATVDARTLEVLGCVTVSDAVNCQYVRADPTRSDHAVALCTGDPFQPESVRRERATVLELSVDEDGAIALGARIDGTRIEAFSVPTAHPLPLGDGRTLALADGRGEDARRPDRLLRLDLSAGTVEVLAESSSFTLGSGTYSHDGTSVLIPDGATNELIRYSLAEGRIVDRIPVATVTGLPLRQISRL
jgi:hypothetical protein